MEQKTEKKRTKGEIEGFEKPKNSKLSKKDSESRFPDTFNTKGSKVFDAISFGNKGYSKSSIVKDTKETGIEKTYPGGKLLAVIRISGEVKVKPKVKNILNRLRLRRKYSCVLINPKNDSIAGMLKKVKFNVAFGDIDRESLVELIKKRGKKINGEKFNSEEVAENLLRGKKLKEIGFKPFFRLHPPRGGIKSKLQYPKGVLSDNKENINKLIRRML